MASFSKSKEARLVNHPSIIENAGMKFLIFDAPSDDNIDAYIEVRNQQTHFASSPAHAAPFRCQTALFVSTFNLNGHPMSYCKLNSKCKREKRWNG